MKKLKVEKYIHHKFEQSFTVPLGLIRILNVLLPNSAIAALNQKGLGLEQIILADRLNKPYQACVEVEEKGIMKTISITLS